MATFEEIRKRAQRPETSVSLCLGSAVLARHQELTRRLTTASTVASSLGERSEASLLTEELRQLEAEMAEASHAFVFQALPAQRWAEFRSTLPDRGDDEEAFKAAYFTWICELISLCCTDPVMSHEQVVELINSLSGWQYDALANAAWSVNAVEVTIPFTVAASARTGSDERK